MNIRGIAKKSGVSTATVSRVLNNSSLVNLKTRQKVMEVVESSNFKLRNASRKNFTIGVSVPTISTAQIDHNFVCEFLAGIAQSVSTLQASIKIIDMKDLLLVPGKKGAYNDFCKEKGINAMIHILAPVSFHSCFEQIADDGVPQVIFEQVFDRTDIFWIDVENQKTSCDFSRSMAQLGATDFAVVTAGRDYKGHRDRYNGFMEGLKEFDIEVPAYWDIERKNVNVEAGVTATLSILASSPKPPRVIYYTNAEFAMGGIKMLLSRNIRLPQDTIIAFFDDSSFANWFPVPVVYLRLPAYEMGLKAGNFFLTQHKGKATHEILTPELFIGSEIVESLENKTVETA